MRQAANTAKMTSLTDSLQADLRQLKVIDEELKRFAEQRKKLEERKAGIQGRLTQFLESRGPDSEPLEYDGVRYSLSSRTAYGRKAKDEKDQQAMQILQRAGVANSFETWTAIQRAAKGEPVARRNLVAKRS